MVRTLKKILKIKKQNVIKFWKKSTANFKDIFHLAKTEVLYITERLYITEQKQRLGARQVKTEVSQRNSSALAQKKEVTIGSY